jgi:hypothetical protein
MDAETRTTRRTIRRITAAFATVAAAGLLTVAAGGSASAATSADSVGATDQISVVVSTPLHIGGPLGGSFGGGVHTNGAVWT